MLNDTLIAQRLREVTESLEVQFALWGMQTDISRSKISLPLNEFVLQLKQEADQVIAAIAKNARHDMKWDMLQKKLIDLMHRQDDTGLRHEDEEADHGSSDTFVDVGNRDQDTVDTTTEADKFLYETTLQYMDILEFYHSMQLSMDHYHALVQTRDYYTKLRGSVWKYTVIPLQFWKRGFEISTFKSMFTAKTLKVHDLVNAADILATPTRLINFELDDVSKKLTSEIDSLLITTGEQLSRFEKSGKSVSRTDNVHDDRVSLESIMSHISKASQVEFSIPADIRIPPWYQRQWFQLSVVSLYGPVLLRTLVQNGQSMWQMVSQGAYEFVSGLWENWIWTPITQIWDTIRFDSGELYITSPENLTSELNSLIRMIVEFLRDRSGSGDNVNVDALTKQIMDGDLHEFMRIYEHQIENPVKSLVFDNMVRSLLIQLQKVKVDGSMAMNGINKLMKSQQLLFSIVSLLPALLILWALRNFLSNTINSGLEWARDSEGTRFRIKRSLNEIERILNLSDCQESESHEEQMKGIAVLNLEIASLKMTMAYYLPKTYTETWARDCNDLGDYTASDKARLNVVNRIHHMYGKFI